MESNRLLDDDRYVQNALRHPSPQAFCTRGMLSQEEHDEIVEKLKLGIIDPRIVTVSGE